jgi:hypothetical protein
LSGSAKVFVQVSQDAVHFKSVACIKEFDSPLIYIAETNTILNHFARATESISARLKIVKADGEVYYSDPYKADQYAAKDGHHLH